MAAAAAGHTDWGVLPLDVLALLASFVPLRPRMLHLSLISRRWRAAALLSVKEISMNELWVKAMPPEAQRRSFVRLQHLISPLDRLSGWPTSLRALTLHTLGTCTSVDDVAPYSQLESISVRCKGSTSREFSVLLAVLVQRSASSLTSLSMDNYPMIYREGVILNLSHLRTLRFTGRSRPNTNNFIEESLRKFTDLHTLALSMAHTRDLTCLASLSYPNLTDLSLGLIGESLTDERDALEAALRKLSPQLRSVKLLDLPSRSGDVILRLVGPALRSLKSTFNVVMMAALGVKDTSPSPTAIALLEACPNVRKLKNEPGLLGPDSPLLPSLSSLQPGPESSASLAACSNLRVLRKKCAKPSAPLPLVTRASIPLWQSYDAYRDVKLLKKDVSEVLQLFPNLCRIDVYWTISEGDLDAAVAWLRELARQSRIREVHLVNYDKLAANSEIPSAVYLLARRVTWINVTIRYRPSLVVPSPPYLVNYGPAAPCLLPQNLPTQSLSLMAASASRATSIPILELFSSASGARLPSAAAPLSQLELELLVASAHSSHPAPNAGPSPRTLPLPWQDAPVLSPSESPDRT